MGSSLSMSGHEAELKYGYHVAAKLGAWTLSLDRVDAVPLEVNELWIDEEPLSISLLVGRSAWTWKQITVISMTPELSVRLHGSPEVRVVR